jgi:Na+-translocating ferredoxin:NAD+ oxidoreductase RnfA subunit
VASRDARVTVGTISKILLWIVYVWVVLNLVLLFLAFWLRLFGANPQADFTQWVYRSVSRSMAPFRGIFEPIVLSDESVLDTSLLFAMIIYGVVALLLRAGIDWVTTFVSRRQRRVEQEFWDDRLEALPASGASAAGLR